MDRIWIEFERPRDNAHAEAICAKANRMLARLRKPGDVAGRFEWNSKRSLYCYGTDMGFEDLADRGQWFSLDYFGRE